jgi:hypothetical protein
MTHQLLLTGGPGWVQGTCPCPAGWMSRSYSPDEDYLADLRREMAAHTGDGPDQTWCNWCGQPMTPDEGGDWITCPNAGTPEICTDCCGDCLLPEDYTPCRVCGTAYHDQWNRYEGLCPTCYRQKESNRR